MAGVDIHRTKREIGKKGEVIPEDFKEAHHSGETIIEDNLVDDRRNKNNGLLSPQSWPMYHHTHAYYVAQGTILLNRMLVLITRVNFSKLLVNTATSVVTHIQVV